MKKLKFFLLASALLLTAACSNPFKDEIEELEYEVEQLKNMDDQIINKLNTINDDISAMYSVVNAIRGGVYIKSIQSVTDAEGREGYRITLNNGETFNVYDGKDGKDGYSPSVGVKMDGNDGVYYWTLDGEYMKDSTGSRIRADGARPLFEIRDGYWYISYDGGKTWQNLGQKAVGENGQNGLDGQSQFSVEYTSGSNVVKFIMKDTGEVITLPCYQTSTLAFDIADGKTSISAGENIQVKYTIANPTENTVVTASSDGNYKVSVEKVSESSGIIHINCPGLYKDGHITVMTFDGVGYASIYVISFFEKQMSLSTAEKTAKVSGETFNVNISHNFEFYTEFDSAESAKWLSVARNDFSETNAELKVKVEKNEGNAREGYVHIYATNSPGEPYASIKVNQDGSTFTIDKSNFVVDATTSSVNTTISTTRTITVESTESWMTPSLNKTSSDKYTLVIDLKENTSSSKRGGRVNIISAGQVIATVELIQLAKGDDKTRDLVFVVRANEANDYVVYLPIKRTHEGTDCVVDWGDGKQETVSFKYLSDQGSQVYHKYSNVTSVGQNFTVSVSGKLEALTMNDVPSGRRSTISSVTQWGNTGLKSMSNAFRQCTSLTSLPSDNSLAFGEVTDFSNAFRECIALKSIAGGMFTSAKKVRDFSDSFRDCSSLENLPEALFANCSSASTFEDVFYGCTALKSVPSRLFEGCSSAKNFVDAFYRCSALTSVAADIFRACSSATSFGGLFLYCEALTSIGESLFDDCINATDFTETFYDCKSLVTLPKLFSKTSSATTFNGTFGKCSSIKSIPKGLFDNCPNAYYFSGVFENCTSITGAPTDLFDNNTMVTNFGSAFGGCKNLRGESPYTVVNGKKVHLYERSDYPDYFVKPTNFGGCFKDCTLLSDYSTIENNYSSWK